MESDNAEDLNDQIIQDTLDRKPSPFPKLLMWTPIEGQNAQIYPSLITTSGMIADYFEFARDHPMPPTHHEQDLDRRLLPLLFVYRHATELAIKYAIVQLIRQIQQRKSDFTDVVPEHHKLGPLLEKAKTLYERAKPYLNEMGNLEFISPQAQEFIRELDALDPKGEAFRYARGKRDKLTGTTNPQITETADVSIEALRAGMLHIEKEILWFIDMVQITTDLYDQGTADMQADFRW